MFTLSSQITIDSVAQLVEQLTLNQWVESSNLSGVMRGVSSVGLEHYLDRVGVTGSNPVHPTFLIRAIYGTELPLPFLVCRNMNPDSIYSSLNSIYPITTEAWNAFRELLEPIDTHKNDFLIREGEQAKYCYMLVDGVVRVFYNKEGAEYNKTFFIPGTFPTPLTALLSGNPCQLSFQALVPSRLVRFSYRGFRDLFDDHHCFESMMLRILELEWIKKERHDIQMVTNDATTNYMIFREDYPGLENLIPQYHIASYLGITPIQLSRIRAQLVNS